jgi:DNA (cytosine-5)-methyltransferase 1
VTYGSLFSGIGGIDLGLDRAGMECRWQVELDPFCRKVLTKYWPEVPKYGDIRQLTGGELEWVDLIAGGFPCQDLSQAGKRAGIEGNRSGLWFEFARLIGKLRPRFVLIENVPGLLDRRAMPRVIGELARLGYVGSWFCLRASDFGAAHLRKRVFILAYRACERKDEPGLDQQARMFPTPAARDYRTPNKTAYSERGGGAKGEQLQNFVEHHLDLNSPPVRPTLDGQKSSEPSPHSRRRLNPRFVEWLMGFPIGWTEL